MQRKCHLKRSIRLYGMSKHQRRCFQLASPNVKHTPAPNQMAGHMHLPQSRNFEKLRGGPIGASLWAEFFEVASNQFLY